MKYPLTDTGFNVMVTHGYSMGFNMIKFEDLKRLIMSCASRIELLTT
jgi:hypothetical protein